MTAKKIDLSRAKCSDLSFDAAVELKRTPGGTGITGFDIDAYTGAVVDRWWGKLAINVDGIISKQQMPIFKNHNPDEIVGYSTKATSDSNFKVSGVFSKTTEAAKEVIGLAEEGFPWQASIGVKPKTILELREDASMEVNGTEVSGPAEVWLESEVYETSFVPLGADGSTGVTVFSEIERAIAPTKTREVDTMTLEELREKHPELVALIAKEATSGNEEALAAAREEGATTERERIQAVKEQSLPGHEDLVESLAFDGKTTGAEAAVKVLAAEKESQRQKAEDFKNNAPQPAAQPANNNTSTETLTGEEALKAKWDKDKALQLEFMCFEDYQALMDTDDGIVVKNKFKGE